MMMKIFTLLRIGFYDKDKCPVKYNADNIDYTLKENRDFDCDDKKLTLKIHPDKNPGCEDCGTEVFKQFNDQCL